VATSIFPGFARGYLFDGEDGGGVATFREQDIECSAGGRRVHDFEARAAASHGEDEFARCEGGLPAGAENDDVGFHGQYRFQVNNFKFVDTDCRPVANNGFRRDREGLFELFVANANPAAFDMQYGGD